METVLTTDFSVIAAFSLNRTIGNKGTIPWNLPSDRKHFKELTQNNIVIFGRKTFEEIGKALPERINIVISKTKNFSSNNLYTVHTIEEALLKAKEIAPEKQIFLCGGENIYKRGLSPLSHFKCTKIYTTEILAKIEGDKFFPEIDTELYKKVYESEVKTEGKLSYKFVNWELKSIL